jgi:feruloyl-CoA synthase
VQWASLTPDALFLAERPGGDVTKPWMRLTYAETLAKVEALAGGLLRLGLSAERPLAVLSDNSIDHALLSLAAMHVGVPVSSISQAYSLMSKDHDKLKSIIRTLGPGAVYVPDTGPFGPALTAIAPLFEGTVIAGLGEFTGKASVSLASLYDNPDKDAVARAFSALSPQTIAKVLFTSGSTGEPKGVINTHAMLCASQEAKAALWTFLEEESPVILDWLPWSHTFGANHNFNMVLRNGGALYIDSGKPVPGLFEKTLANIRDVESAICFNVPRGFDMLVVELERDKALASAFFDKLKVIFYAGAALPQTLWAELERLSMATRGDKVAMVSSWGSTETAPLATDCYFQAERSGVIGLPVPGCELKLVPNGDKQEIRVRGANVTPGYWKRPDLSAKAFDEEGFYVIGDAVRFFDPAHPEKGLVFDGRVAEDFKLMSGTWVSVGQVRVKGIEHLFPIAQDIVVTGHDREEVGFLVFANPVTARQVSGLPESAGLDAVLAHPTVVALAHKGLRALKAEGGGTASFATRALLMAEPPSVDAGEITDKGYINQRAVLTRRAALVQRLYDVDGAAKGVIRL